MEVSLSLQVGRGRNAGFRDRHVQGVPGVLSRDIVFDHQVPIGVAHFISALVGVRHRQGHHEIDVAFLGIDHDRARGEPDAIEIAVSIEIGVEDNLRFQSLV